MAIGSGGGGGSLIYLPPTARQKHAGSHWLYDETTGDIVGVKDPDGSEFFFARAAHFASFYDTTDQAGVANAIQQMSFNTTSISFGVSVVDGSKIKVSRDGVYNIQFSAQFENSDTQEQDVSIWLRHNGVDVPQSNSFVGVVASHGGTPGHCIPSWNFYELMSAGDYIQLCWSSPSALVSIQAIPAQTSPVRPATPSIILTINEVAA